MSRRWAGCSVGPVWRCDSLCRSRSRRCAHGGERRTMREDLEAKHGFTVSYDIPGLPVEYRGAYDDVTGVARGTWQINPRQLVVRAGWKFLMLTIKQTTGSWRMRRAYG